jgi:hypothetical protein
MSGGPPICPGCGLALTDPADCDRCEYFNLASGRYHYCGQPHCYCRYLPGLNHMYPEIRQQFLDRYQASQHE